MNLEDIMLSKISQTQKGKYYVMPLILVPRKDKFEGIENRTVVARGWGEGERGIVSWVWSFRLGR